MMGLKKPRLHPEALVITDEEFLERYGREREPLERPRSPAELKAIVAEMNTLATQFYWAAMRAGMATKCHPFLEFSALMTQYVQACGELARNGIDYSLASREGRMVGYSHPQLPLSEDAARYLADKLDCIFGAAIRGNPKVARIIRDGLGL